MVRLSILNAYLSMGMVDDHISKVYTYDLMYLPVRARLLCLRKNKNADGSLIHPSVLPVLIAQVKEALHYFKFRLWRVTASEAEEAVIYDLPFRK